MQDGFMARLAQGPLLCDGAMGTTLYSRGVPFEQCFDELNLSAAALILNVHEEYVRAGASIIETNTFGANRHKLEVHSLAERVADINRAGVRLARQAADAAGRRIFVAASVGPLGAQLAPVGSLTREEARDAFREQISALAAEEPDLILFETFADLKEITEAVRAAQETTNLPLVAQMTFTNDGVTPVGYTPEQVAHALLALKVNVIGVNCSVGPARVLAIVERMIRTVKEDPRRPALIHFSAQPNAGFPEASGGRIFYPSTPEYFGDYTRRFLDAGVSIVGGCCGTTADHTRAMRRTLDALAQLAPPRVQIISPATERTPKAHPAAEPATQLKQKLDSGGFVVSVEADPPRGFGLDVVLAGSLILKQAGADVVNIADTPRAQMRMSPWAVAHLVQSEVGIETVLHFPVRGRNLLRVHGDLLAAHALHVRNIFAVMGDPPAIGDYPGASDTYDLVPSGLTSLIKKSFNNGVDHAGLDIGQPCSFTVGVALDMGARDQAHEIKTLQRKIQAGADFALTQPVFDPAIAYGFIQRYQETCGPLKLPLIVGILPLYNTRHAEFLHNEVPGITLTDEVRERMRKAGTDGRAEGIKIAGELWAALGPLARGVYIMPPFNRYELVAELLTRVK